MTTPTPPAGQGATCKTCDGTGRIEDNSSLNSRPRRCPDCSFAGQQATPCPECNGDGRIQEGTGHANSEGGEDWREVPCPKCSPAAAVTGELPSGLDEDSLERANADYHALESELSGRDPVGYSDYFRLLNCGPEFLEELRSEWKRLRMAIAGHFGPDSLADYSPVAALERACNIAMRQHWQLFVSVPAQPQAEASEKNLTVIANESRRCQAMYAKHVAHLLDYQPDQIPANDDEWRGLWHTLDLELVRLSNDCAALKASNPENAEAVIEASDRAGKAERNAEHYRDKLAAAESRAEQLAEALGKVWRATNTPDHKRNDTEWLRAATSIAYSFADAALAPPAPTTAAKGAANGQ